MKANQYRITKFNNGTSMKIHNRRISVIRIDNGTIKIQFVKLGNQKWDCQEIVRGKIIKTTIGLSLEAAEALFFALQNELIEIQNSKYRIQNN